MAVCNSESNPRVLMAAFGRIRLRASACAVLALARDHEPDAVIRGSRIWSGSWREERAAANKIGTDDVEEFYRKRSLLQRSVFPEDVAEGIYFFASEVSGKSTGNILNVDAGNAVAFTR